LPNKLVVWNRNPNIRLRLQPSKNVPAVSPQLLLKYGPVLNSLSFNLINYAICSSMEYSKAVVGNHRAAVRCRSVRSSLPGRIIFHV